MDERADKKEPTKHSRERLTVQTAAPPRDLIYDMWWRAQRAPGRLIELPFDVPGCQPMTLTVETNVDGERPQWTCYAGDGVLWSYVLSDTEMIWEIITLSITPSESSIADASKPLPTRPASPTKLSDPPAAAPAAASGSSAAPSPAAAKERNPSQSSAAPAKQAEKPKEKSKSVEPVSYVQQGVPNLMLGRILVESGLIPKDVLEAALNLQDLVRKSGLTPIEATDVLRKVQTQGKKVEQVIAELKGQEYVEPEPPKSDAVDLLKQAGFVSEQDIIKAKHVIVQLRKAGLDSPQGAETAKALLDLLRLAGFITDEDIRRASASSSNNPTEICKSLLSSGTIDALSFEVASRFVKHVRRSTFKQEQAIIALHYSQRSRTGFEETVHALGWKVPIES